MKKTWFVSDVHLGLNVNDPKDRERRFMGFLKDIDPANTDALYLLGDIFDFWYEYKYVVPKGFTRILARLQDLVESGVKVYFFPGNHDIWTYHYFEELGIVKLQEPFVTEIGGKKFVLGHGDSLGPFPFGYKVMYSVFHNKLAQVLFSTLHPRLAFALGNAWSKNNRLSRHEKYVFAGDDSERLVKFIKKFVAENGPADYFVFGHYHDTVRLDIPGCGHLAMTDSWIEESPYLVFSETGLTSGNWGSLPKMVK
ncbi:MAG: UDP-2,3-diacylglucosamine diphosphatase [Bacteroidales bacterium]|nr:UDP-2,3-diacylglucosamine diphosphatase [Bacteroidales bacterium]